MRCSLSEANLKTRCLAYKDCFKELELVFPLSALRDMSDEQREDLWALHKFGVQISYSDQSHPNIWPNSLAAVQLEHWEPIK